MAPPTTPVKAYKGTAYLESWTQKCGGQARGLMLTFLALKTPMAGFHVERFLQHDHTDTLHTELHKALCYATTMARNWMTSVGQEAAPLTPTDVTTNLSSGPYAPDAALCGGTLGMLDVAERVEPMDQLSMGLMHWTCEALHNCSQRSTP